MVRVAAAMEDVDTLIVMPKANADPFRALCTQQGIAHHALALTRITKEWKAAIAYLLFSPLEVLILVRLFKAKKIDLVHASGGSWQYKGVIAAKLAGIPSVWHLNDTAMPKWVHILFRMFSTLPTGFIFASYRSRDYYGDHLANRLQDVVPSTVEPKDFDPQKPYKGDEDIIDRLGNAPVIGTVANINPVKALEALVRTVARLRQDTPGLRAVVVGPVYASQQRYFEKLSALADKLGVADAIEWVGGRKDVRPLLARMDVYVCCSNAESSPVSVWEAMAMAKPVVSTDVGDVSHHIQSGENGYIVPVGDVTSLASRVSQLLEDKEMANRLGGLARKTVLENFSPTHIAEKTAALYRKALEASKNKAHATP